MSNDPASYLSGTELRVCKLIAERQMRGIAKYGTTVSDNPLPLRAWLRHALEECLDHAIYLQRAIEEIDNREVGQNPAIKDVQAFAERFLNPSDLGYTVSASIRDDARQALGIKRTETQP
jgi:hypothetical protein